MIKYLLIISGLLCSLLKAQNPVNITITSPPTNYAVDSYTRAQTSINLKATATTSFKYGFVTPGSTSTNLLNLSIGTYPTYVNNNYDDTLSANNNINYNPSLIVGTVEGAGSVSPIGAFTHNIPIYCSPGTAGIQPNLSIVYNSNVGNGLLGMGWAMSGISAITKTHKTVYYDGVNDGIKLNNSDVFSLDGSRLLASSGVYGQPFSTYKTEVENYYSITSYGQTGSEPSFFKVGTPDGKVAEYGVSADAKLHGEGSSNVLAWFINKLTDANGNYMTFSYINSNGEILIDKIEYSRNAAAGSIPYNKIVFEYIDRSDVKVSYVNGQKFNQKKLLKSITSTDINNSLVRKYIFDYQYSFASLLYKITEIDSKGNTLNPTYLEWTKSFKSTGSTSPFFPVPNEVVGTHITTSMDISNVIQSIAVDMNGDGKKDLVAIKQNGIGAAIYYDVYKSVPTGLPSGPRNGFAKETITNNVLEPASSIEIIGTYSFDEDDDNYEEVFLAFAHQGGSNSSKPYFVKKIKFDGTNYITSVDFQSTLPSNATEITTWHASGKVHPASEVPRLNRSSYLYTKQDLTGDNLTDKIVVDQKGIRIEPSNGQLAFDFPLDKIVKSKVGDFNGDGRVDLCILRHADPTPINSTTCKWKGFILEVYSYDSGSNTVSIIASKSFDPEIEFSSSCVTPNLKTFFEISSNSIDFGDFNGDGQMDLLYLKYSPTLFAGSAPPANAEAYVLLSDGIGFQNASKVADIPTMLGGKQAAFFLADINNDGLADLGRSSFDASNNTAFLSYYPSTGKILAASPVVYSRVVKFAGTLGDFDGDGTLDYIAQLALNVQLGIEYNVFNHTNKRMVRRIHNIKDDYKIEYSLLVDRKAEDGYKLYNKTTSTNPVAIKITRPALFVVTTTNQNGVGTKYGYENALFHRELKGFIGFERNVVYNQNTNIVTVSTHTYDETNDLLTISQSSAGIASPTVNVFISILPAKVTSRSKSTYNYITTGTNRYLSNITTESRDFLRSLRSLETTNFDNTKGGNVSSASTSFYPWLGSGAIAIRGENTTYACTTLTHPISVHNFYKPSKITIVKTANVNGAQVSSQPFETDITYSSTGNIVTKVDYPNSTLVVPVTTSYGPFDFFGNPKGVSVSAPDLPLARTNQMEYDVTGRFLTKATNPIGNITEMAYEPAHGKQTILKDISGLTTTYSYDGLGKLVKVVLPNGAVNTTFYEWNSYMENFINLVYGVKISTYIEGAETTIKRFDRNGNLQRLEQESFNGAWQVHDYTYNSINQLTQEYVNNSQFQGVSQTISHTHDEFLRPLKTSQTISGITTDVDFTYNALSKDGIALNVSTGGFSTVKAPTSNPTEFIFRRTENNEAGQIDRVANYSNISFQHSVNYKYNEFNMPYQANNVYAGTGAAVTTFEYDVLGRQNKLVDPAAGTSSYVYNGIGELTQETTPNGTYSFDYDKLGRLTTKTGASVYSYQYETAANGREQLKQITGPNVITDLKYDNFSRLIEKKETITSSGNKILKSNFTYDKYGNVLNYTYPGGFVITNEYDVVGNLIKIKNNNTIIWQLNSMHTPNLVSQFSCNNGQMTNSFAYDNALNLSQINYGSLMQQSYTISPKNGDLLRRVSLTFPSTSNNEQFKYDEFDRLIKTEYANSLNTIVPKANVTYKPNGNIDVKSDAGNYVYGLTANPYQLTNINNASSNISLHDLHVTYTDFKKVQQITEDVSNKEMDFTYGNDEERIKMEYKIAGNNQYTRYYSDGYDREESGSNYREWSYVYAPTGLAAVYYNSNGTGQLLYAANDRLGSVVMLSDAAGNAIEEYSYDAWGRRRDPADWNNYIVGQPNFMIRGFTGHEHLDEFKLINMNGRVYDPILGRFLQPDNYVQEPDNLQNFNRYTYCMNNPTKYTDPSGQIFWAIPAAIGFVAGGYIGGVIASNGEWNPFNWDDTAWKGAAVGALAGMSLGVAVSFGVAAGGVYTASGGMTTSFNIAATTLSSASFNMATSALSGGDLDDVLKNGLAGAAFGAAFGGLATLPVGGFLRGVAAGAIGGFVDGLYESNQHNLKGAERNKHMGWSSIKGAVAGGVAGAIAVSGSTKLKATSALPFNGPLAHSSEAATYGLAYGTKYIIEQKNNFKSILAAGGGVATVAVGTIAGGVIGYGATFYVGGWGAVPGAMAGFTLGMYYGLKVGNYIYKVLPEDKY